MMKKGDTIVEVLFATAIFGFVAISVLAVMQRGMMAGQLSLEIGLARNAMDSQAEAIRLITSQTKNRLNSSSFETHNDLNYFMNLQNDIEPMNKMVKDGKCQIPSNDRFVLDIRNQLLVEQQIDQAMVYPRLVYNTKDQNLIDNNKNFYRSEGIWIQAIRIREAVGSGKTYDAVDFHIRACWQNPISEQPITLATIVRVYDEKDE